MLRDVQVVLLRERMGQEVVIDLLAVVLGTDSGDIGFQVAVAHITQPVLVEHHVQVGVGVVVVPQIVVGVRVADQGLVTEVLVLELVQLPVDDFVIGCIGRKIVVVHLRGIT